MKIFKGVLFYIFSFLGIFILLKLFMFYVPFLVGFIIAQILEPIIRFIMKKTKLERKLACIIVVFTFFIFLIVLLFLGGVFIISETSSFLANFNEYLNRMTEGINTIAKYINISKLNLNPELKNIFGNTTIDFINTFAKNFKKYLTNFLGLITSLPKLFIYIIITILATYFISSDKIYILDQMEYHLPKKWVAKIRESTKKITSSLGSYLKAEIIMILISFIIVLIGLNIFYFLDLNIKYPILMAIIIGFVDSLPILRKPELLLFHGQ